MNSHERRAIDLLVAIEELVTAHQRELEQGRLPDLGDLEEIKRSLLRSLENHAA
tara:strand:+ start:1854 stop:2015 length:162 start_codon:yes stop_codon:yes gene_type:complete